MVEEQAIREREMARRIIHKMNNADEIEQAKFVLLSLIGKLYVLSKQSIGEKQKEYGEKIKQLQKELKLIDKSVILAKIRDVYIPYMQHLKEEEGLK